jgi:hypothetical protein
MKTLIVGTSLAGLLGLALTASAQQPPQPQPQPRPDPPAAAAPAPDRDTKLTGCVKPGTEAGTFELTTSKKPASKVALAPAAGVNLQAHLNHQVELTGSWLAAAPAAADAAKDAEKKARTFSVTDVKMIAATCPTGTE